MGVIPYLGTFLTDLTMTHTAFPDHIHSTVTPSLPPLTPADPEFLQTAGGDEVELVNFDKRRKEFHILAQLSLYQKSASLYSFPHNPSLVHWLASSSTLSPQLR